MSLTNTPYVKFLRGTADAYKAATIDANTLYFIYDDETKVTGSLYMGATKICSGAAEELSVTVDNISIEKSEVNGTISLKNYQKQYYKYVPATETEPEKYELTSGWISGLQPKIGSDGTLEWYETDAALMAKLNALNQKISTNATNLNNLDAGLNDRIDARIAANTAQVLTFKIVETKESIDVNEKDADRYIYLVPNGNVYDEYIVINTTIEKIGDTSVNLDQYATTQYVTEQIAGLNTSITQLENTLTQKDNEIVATISELNSQINSLQQADTGFIAQLKTLNDEISSLKVKDTEYLTSLNTIEGRVTSIEEALTWGTV